MDFRLGSNLVRSTAASNNGGSLASETDADVNELRMYGSVFLNRDSKVGEDALPPRISPCGGDMAKASLQECTQQMLSFSSPHDASVAAFPLVRSSSGYGCGSANGASMHGVIGPFTQSQWMELEHQALIFKYITANVPIPSYLLNPIRKALQSSGLSCFSILRPNALGWSGFHLGFSKTDPEPGRCRRTDGKKWRCSRDAVADQKYCERHMNRGRHRSRKPVEGQPGHSVSGIPTSKAAGGGASKTLSFLHRHQSSSNHTPAKTSIDRCLIDGYTEFGSVCSDSLLNPLDRSSSLVNGRNREDGRKSGHPLLQFIDEWPKNQASNGKEAAFEATQMGVGVAAAAEEKSWVGGPLGEALHTAGECKALNLMEPHRARGGPESKRSLMLPSLPAL